MAGEKIDELVARRRYDAHANSRGNGAFFGNKHPPQGVNTDDSGGGGVGAATTRCLKGAVKDVVARRTPPSRVSRPSGVYTELIERNTTIPTENQKYFSTASVR